MTAFADKTLSNLEQAFIRAVEGARTFRPGLGDKDWSKGIRGELIRAMLLGTELLHHPDKAKTEERRSVAVTGHGIRIDPGCEQDRPPPALLVIGGELDLAGLAAQGGGCLPPLEFGGCRIEPPLHLGGAHIQDLTLRYCRFRKLSAHAARFGGNVTLSHCRPLNDPADEGDRRASAEDLSCAFGDRYALLPARPDLPGGSAGCSCGRCNEPGNPGNCTLCCIVDLSSAAVAGGLTIRATYLRGPPAEAKRSQPNIRDCCALNLCHTQIRDSLVVSRCMLVGGASMVSAEIGDDVWIQGGKLLAPSSRYVLDFQLASIGGVLALQAAPASANELANGIRAFPIILVGQLTGINLSAGEIWIGEGFYYGCDDSGQGSFPTINFAKADVTRSFKVGAYHPQHVLDPERPTGEARIHGEICLAAVNIGKNLELHGVRAPDKADMEWLRPAGDREEKPYFKLRGHGLKIDRRVNISHSHFSDGEAAAGERQEYEPAALDLWKSTIGTGFGLREDCTCVGALRLNSCVIGREVAIYCEKIGPSEADKNSAGFRQGDIPTLVDLGESTVKGHVKIGRRVPRNSEKEGSAQLEGGASTETSQAKANVAVTVVGAISLESANVQGSILLAHVEFDLKDVARVPAKEDLKALHHPPDRAALNLRDCTCGSDLEVHALSWVLPELTANELPPARRRFKGRSAFTRTNEEWYAAIDLRGMQCDLLVDGSGREWNLEYRLQLRLAGIKIGDVQIKIGEVEAPSEEPHVTRLRWLTFQYARQRAVSADSGRIGGVKLGEASPVAQSEAGKGSPGPWKRIARRWTAFWQRFWHRLNCPEGKYFLPHAYDVFAGAYRKVGEDAAAERVLIEKKNIHNVLRFYRLLRKWYFLSFQVLVAVLVVAGGLLLGPFIRRSALVPASGPDVGFVGIGIVAAGFVLFFWPVFVTFFQALFRLGFRYGLSPGAALFSFLILIALGWIGVHMARNGGVATVTDWGTRIRYGVLDPNIALVLDVEPEPTETKPSPTDPEPEPEPCAAGRATGSGPLRSVSGAAQAMAGVVALASKWPPDALIEGQAIHAQAIPCNRNVSSFLYALDVFIPLIDLDQERRCSVRDADPATGHDAYFGWRVLKALYELLGWVVTSLVILTFTGVLRRDLER